MNWILVVLYVIFAVSGSTLLKYGGLSQFKSLFTVPVVNMSISWITLIGFICYGASFLFYTVLLNKFDLSLTNFFREKAILIYRLFLFVKRMLKK